MNAAFLMVENEIGEITDEINRTDTAQALRVVANNTTCSKLIKLKLIRYRLTADK